MHAPNMACGLLRSRDSPVSTVELLTMMIARRRAAGHVRAAGAAADRPASAAVPGD
jgi:hypothetical protein